MINVKLLVLFVCINNIRECYSDYCKICPRHTLCLYKNPGPGPYCSLYDNTALLTKDDVESIVNKINQRRNFVALGLARNLPSAANMNKMRWSEELSVSAQRWADQCEPSIRPDKKDMCRDLVDTKVGQSIATVTGLSPGLNVKSFVEMWYMQALEYTGSVTYYNQSQDSKTNDFTQLIWAETTRVGCGKARFSIDDKGTMIDRLVCNFAPKGNVQGKPVYTIGFPATQCKENFQKDEIFAGLCRPSLEKTQETTAPTESSLLRIINLPNNPVKLDIDPLRVDPKNRDMSQDMINFIRHQNLRHIPNRTRGFIHHVTQPRQHNLQELPHIPPKHDVIPRQHPYGHFQNVQSPFYRSRLPIEQYRRNDYTREPLNRQCTRNSGMVTTHDDNACQGASKIEPRAQCTRKDKKINDYILTTQSYCRSTEKKEHKTCNLQPACNSQRFTCILNPTTTPDICNLSCHCPNINNPRTESRRRIPGEYVYYDYPNLSLRGGDELEERNEPSHSIQITASLPKDRSDVDSDYFTRVIKTLGFSDNRQTYRRNYRNRNHRNFVNQYRPKRQIEKQFSDMSFWKADEFDKRSQKRTPRYTTLRSNHKKYKTIFGHLEMTTEPITLTVKDLNKHRHDNTDRSLSFDELMYFRKNRGGDVDSNMRRKNQNIKKPVPRKPAPKKSAKKLSNTENKSTISTSHTPEEKTDEMPTTTTPKSTTTITTTVTTASTTLMTIIGSFSPQSMCTRRITCTWTQPVITDSNGKVITSNGGGGGGGGSGGGGGGGGGRTPWGHVENCTRKYTCSRLYYDRNVQASDTAAGDSTDPDEDYCERRALNVKRKVSYESGITIPMDLKQLTENSTLAASSMKNDNTHNNVSDQTDCYCDNQDPREKRSVTCKHKEKKVQECRSKEKVTPNNLYLLAFSKIIQMWENNRNTRKVKNKPSGCHCNSTVATYMYSCHIFILFVFYAY